MPDVSAIVTHEHPDMDGILAIWLLRRFGGERFPGIERAPVRFYPAGVPFEGKSAAHALETDGVLLVDTGGGPFDHHADHHVPRTAETDCTATRVAKALCVQERAELKKILGFVRRQDAEGRGLTSKDPAEHLIALPNLLSGLHLVNDGDHARTVAEVEKLYEAMYRTELEWARAVEDVQHGLVFRLAGDLTVVGVKSASPKIMKAARYRKFDLCVAEDEQGLVGITPRTSPKLPAVDFSLLAGLLRRYEADVAQAPLASHEVRAVGMHGQWFLHDSLRIVSCGSRKNTQVERTRLPLSLITELTACAFDAARALPEPICPRSHCRGPSCPIWADQAPNCAALKRELETSASHSG